MQVATLKEVIYKPIANICGYTDTDFIY